MAEDQREMVEPEELAEALAQVTQFLDSRGWDYCLIGGLAACYWGRARSTSDIDFVLLTGIGDEAEFIKPLMKTYKARFDNAAQFAMETRLLLLRAKNGVGIDISFGAIPFEEEMLKPATISEVLPGVPVRTASAEDIIVMKSIAGRPRDVDDIERIIAAQGKKLDLTYIRHWLANLAEMLPEVDVLGRFEGILISVNTRMKNAPKPKKPRKTSGD